MFARVILFVTLLISTINCGTDNSSSHNQPETPSSSNNIAVAADLQTQQRLCAEVCEHFRQTCNFQPSDGDFEECLDECRQKSNSTRSEFFKPLAECVLSLSACPDKHLGQQCETSASVGLKPTEAHYTYARSCTAIANTCHNVSLNPECDIGGKILTYTDERTNAMTACFTQACESIQACLSALD